MDNFYEEATFKQPSPLEFDIFLPWACNQLQVKENVHVTKIKQSNYMSIASLSDRSRKKIKPMVSKHETTIDLDSDGQSFNQAPSVITNRGYGVQILAIYNSANHVAELKLLNNKSIPRTIFQVLHLIVKYHEHLNTLSINRGLDLYTLHDISKFLPYSNITDICLDDTYIKEGNYHILLEQKSSLRYLSMSRCSINDDVIKALAKTLTVPNFGSQSLSILNLSSNRITDEGCKFLSEALRSNRKLSYLNLSNNNLTDCGSIYLLNSFLKFPTTFTELLASRTRHIAYLKDKNALRMQILKELRTGDVDKRNLKRKSARPSPVVKKKGGVEREGSAKSIPDSRNLGEIDIALLEKASTMADNSLGPFKDPFDKDNITVEDDIAYSYGNNTLCYLNLAYNNLSYVTIKKLLRVLKYQKEADRKPRGLMNVRIEGNNMPKACKEFTEIDNLIEISLTSQGKRFSLQKKRPIPKSVTR